MIKKILRSFILLTMFFLSPRAFAKTINIVAAENFYGGIAQQLGGKYVHVTSILNNPNQDPHLFSATPSIAKAIANADIIVYNGIGYDSWIERLLASSQHKSQKIIIAADLLNKKMGDNPHIWYDPAVSLLYAKKLTGILIELDPKHSKIYQHDFLQFNQQHTIFIKKVQALKEKYKGTPVIVTEPVFNDMANALGLIVHAKDFQLSIMNDIAPSPSQTKSFESDLQNKKVKLLIYNNQVSDPTTQRMQNIAQRAGIPVIGISELQPPGKNYFEWMEGQLDSLRHALPAS